MTKDETDPLERTVEVSDSRVIQLTSDVLDRTDLRVGDRMRIEIHGDDQIRLIRSRRPDRKSRLDALEKLIGSAPGLSAATDLESLRDEWNR